MRMMWRALGWGVAAVMMSSCTNVDEAEVGCTDDTMCRADRVCQEGRCVFAQLSDLKEEGLGASPDAARDMMPGDQDIDASVPGAEEPEVCIDDRSCELCVSFKPGVLDFGSVPLSQKRVKRFEMSNCSREEALIVSDFGVEGDAQFAMNAWSLGAGPFVMAAGADAFVEVVYVADSGSARASFVAQVSARGGEPDTVTLEISGVGSVEPSDNQCPVAVATGQPSDGSMSPRRRSMSSGLACCGSTAR